MKHVSANKLNKLWKDGILPALLGKIDRTKVLTTMEQVEANTNAENIASALVIGQLNNNLGGLSFYEDSDGNKYVVGADSVPKKLGSLGTLTLTVTKTYNADNNNSNTITATVKLNEETIINISNSAQYWLYQSLSDSYDL